VRLPVRRTQTGCTQTGMFVIFLQYFISFRRRTHAISRRLKQNEERAAL